MVLYTTEQEIIISILN